MRKIKVLSTIVLLIAIFNCVLNVAVYATSDVLESNKLVSEESDTLFGTSKYIYPITPKGTPEKWREFTSHTEMINACEIPQDVIEKMTTKQLLLTCMNYPLLGDALCYSNVSYGFEAVMNHSNAMIALYERSDLSSEIVSFYQKLELNNIAATDEILGLMLITNHAISQKKITDEDVGFIFEKSCEFSDCRDNSLVYKNIFIDIKSI